MLLLWKPVVKRLKDETISYINEHSLEWSKVAIFLLNWTKASEVYVKMKAKYAASIWLTADIMFWKDRELADILEEIHRCNLDSSYSWVMVQLPVADQCKQHQMKILDSIHPSKDIDGLWSVMFGKAWFWWSEIDFLSATYRSAMHILDHYSLWEVSGKVCLVIWKSNLIWKPLLLGLAKRGATILSANSKTPKSVLLKMFSMSEYVFSATWVKHIIGKVLIDDLETCSVPLHKKVLIDIWRGSDDEWPYGDIDWEYFEDKVKAVTPVPWWVWPATVASLFHNILSLPR